jgi:hypothetical protein
VIAGAAIVAAAGLFVILRERQLGLKRSREMPIAPLAAVSDDGAADGATAASTLAKAS